MEELLYDYLLQVKTGPPKVYGSNNDIAKELRRERDLLKKLEVVTNSEHSQCPRTGVADRLAAYIVDDDSGTKTLLPVAKKSELAWIFAQVHGEWARHGQNADREAQWTEVRRRWYVGRIGLPHVRVGIARETFEEYAKNCVGCAKNCSAATWQAHLKQVGEQAGIVTTAASDGAQTDNTGSTGSLPSLPAPPKKSLSLDGDLPPEITSVLGGGRVAKPGNQPSKPRKRKTVEDDFSVDDEDDWQAKRSSLGRRKAKPKKPEEPLRLFSIGDKVQIEFPANADDSDNDEFTVLQGEVVHHQLDDDDEDDDDYRDEPTAKVWLYTCRLLQPAMTNDGAQQQGKYVTNVREAHMTRSEITPEEPRRHYGGKGKMGGKGGKWRPYLTHEQPIIPVIPVIPEPIHIPVNSGKYSLNYSSPIDATHSMFPVEGPKRKREVDAHAMIAAAAATAVHEYLARALGLQPDSDKSAQSLSVQDVLGAAAAAAAAAAQAATQVVKKKNVSFEPNSHTEHGESDSDGSSVYSPDFGIDPLVLVNGTEQSRNFQQALREHINRRTQTEEPTEAPQVEAPSPIHTFLQQMGGKMRPSAPTTPAIPLPMPPVNVDEATKPLHSPKEDMLISAIALRGRRRSSIMPARYSMPEPREMDNDEEDLRRRRKKNLANRRKSLDLLATIATSVANVMADEEEDEIGWDHGMEEDGEEDQLV